jgi:hypothetical protein
MRAILLAHKSSREGRKVKWTEVPEVNRSTNP